MIYSPLRYPGGKNKVAKFMQQVISMNGLEGGVYVEPYAGGAAVALNLLIERKVSKVVINDFDRSIYAFWYSVLNTPEELIRKIQHTPVTLDSWRKQKKIQEKKETVDLLSLGFSTFFLNRANRSGIISGGPIGGLEQAGKWKIDVRFNKVELIKRIRLIASHAKKIELHNEDAVKLINKISKKLPKESLIYFDPPYYVKGKDLYVNHYTHKDHAIVADMVHGITQSRWIVSYDDVDEILKLYKGDGSHKYALRYTTVHGNQGREVMFHNKGLVVPKEVVALNNTHE